MKETVLGKLYVEILGIAPTSDDAQRLIHWKKPAGNAEEKLSGDFGTAVYLSLKSRCPEKGDMSIAGSRLKMHLIDQTSTLVWTKLMF